MILYDEVYEYEEACSVVSLTVCELTVMIIHEVKMFDKLICTHKPYIVQIYLIISVVLFW